MATSMVQGQRRRSGMQPAVGRAEKQLFSKKSFFSLAELNYFR